MSKKDNLLDLSSFFDDSIEMLCVANHEGYFVKLNPRWMEVLGYTEKELMSKPFLEFVHPDDIERTIEIASRLEEEGIDLVSFENRYLDATGNYKWLQWNARVVGEDIFAAARDVTELKTRELFSVEMQEAAKIGYWHLDVETMTPFWSDGTYDIHGVERGTPVDLENAINFYAPEAREAVTEFVNLGFEKGIGWDEELPFVNAHGERLWVRTIGKPSVVGGKVVEMYGVFQDITARKNATLEKDQAYKETEKYRQGLDSHSIVAATDLNGKITYVNDKFCEISGYEEHELIGKDHRIINSGHHSKSFFNELWHDIKSGKSWKGVIKNKAKNGTYYWVDTYITPLTNAAGEINEFLAIRTDITERIELEETVNAQHEQLVKSSRLAALGEMSGGIAHEINNPLAIIAGSSELLRGVLNQPTIDQLKALGMLDVIDRTITRISDIVRGLKSFAREDRELEFEKTSIGKILEDSVSFCREKFKVNGVNLEVMGLPKTEIEANPTQISQIILNLLNNSFHALQDSQEKWVRIEVLEGIERIEVHVEDSGSGIKKDDQDKIFEPFFTTKSVGTGTGLGLGISIGIARSHGGDLRLDTSCKNTKFILTLPKRQPRKEHKAG